MKMKFGVGRGAGKHSGGARTRPRAAALRCLRGCALTSGPGRPRDRTSWRGGADVVVPAACPRAAGGERPPPRARGLGEEARRGAGAARDPERPAWPPALTPFRKGNVARAAGISLAVGAAQSLRLKSNSGWLQFRCRLSQLVISTRLFAWYPSSSEQKCCRSERRCKAFTLKIWKLLRGCTRCLSLLCFVCTSKVDSVYRVINKWCSLPLFGMARLLHLIEFMWTLCIFSIEQ